MIRRLVVGALVVLTTATLFTTPALAGRSPSNSGGGGSLVLVSPRSGTPVFGDTITFDVSTSAAQPFVRLQCYQNGKLGYAETNGFYSGYPWDTNYQLGPTNVWTGGAASCTADLFVSSRKGTSTLASITFSVAGS